MNVLIIAFVYVLSNGTVEANAEICGETVTECAAWQAHAEKVMMSDQRILGYAFGKPQELVLAPKGK